MFAPFMTDTWIAATIVALVAGCVGVFVVLRGDAFLAHAIPHGSFAGAAGAIFFGVSPLLGMGLAAVAAALVIAVLSRRGRRDAVTALLLALLLGMGVLFLTLSGQYSNQAYGLLFGQILGVSKGELVWVVLLGAVSIAGIFVLFRPLLYTSLLPEMAAASGAAPGGMTVAFSLILALATTASVPIVGALLMFSLLVGPPAAACVLAVTPGRALVWSVCGSLGIVWASIAISFGTDLPVGFCVATLSGVSYAVARGWVRARRRMTQTGRPDLESAR